MCLICIFLFVTLAAVMTDTSWPDDAMLTAPLLISKFLVPILFFVWHISQGSAYLLHQSLKDGVTIFQNRFAGNDESIIYVCVEVSLVQQRRR